MALGLLAAGVGAQVLGSYIGGKQSKKAAEAARAQAAEFTNKAIAELEKVGIPSIEAQKIALETPELVFDYVPQLQEQFPEIKSQFEQIEVDPRLAEAQVQALAGLQERADMGLTPAEQAEIDALRRGTAQQEAARQATILQQMEQRGLGDSGLALAAKLSSSQESAQRASEEADRLAAMQFAAKQQALQQLGSMAGTQRAQEFGEQAQQASAADIIAQFNRQQQAGTQARNIEAQRQAELMKQQYGQDLEQQRAQARQTEEMRNKQLQAQKFQQEMQKAGATAGAYTGAGQQTLQAGAMEAAGKQQMWSGIGSALGGAAMLGSQMGDTKK